MTILFCSDPLYPNQVDRAFETEFEAARSAGFSTALFDFEVLTRDGDATAATRRVRTAEEPMIAIYRGWMLRPADYRALYEALQKRGVQLINTPDAYTHCHYLPESYPLIADDSPRTVWLPLPSCLDIEQVQQAVKVFGEAPLIVKDYVKSRKHEWKEACFIPSAADSTAVERVVQRFLEGQGAELNAGLVFREYLPLRSVGSDARGGMPLSREFRIFFVDGQPLCQTRYWSEGDYDGDAPPINHFVEVAQAIRSRFWTMDIAQKEDGNWIIVELGDGQVAGLLHSVDAEDFYQRLKQSLPEL